MKRLKAEELEELELKTVLKHIYDLLFSVYTGLDRCEIRLAGIEELLNDIARKYGIDIEDLAGPAGENERDR